MSLAHENPENFKIPEQTPNEEEKKPTRRGLLIGLGSAGAAALIGGGAAAGGYLAGRGNEAPAPAPEPKPPVETETPTPTETEEPTTDPAPTETETPVREDLVRIYGNIETDQSHDELVKAMSFENGMTPEQLVDRFVDGYNYTVMGGASGNLKIFQNFDPENGVYVSNSELLEEAEARATETTDAFLEAIFGKDWSRSENASDIKDFYYEMVEAGRDSIVRWAYTYADDSTDYKAPEYLRYYESNRVVDTSFYDQLDEGSTNVSYVTKGMESLENYTEPIDLGQPLIDPLDPEIVNGGKIRGFELNFGREDYAENNGYDRPVVTFVRTDDNVMNLGS